MKKFLLVIFFVGAVLLPAHSYNQGDSLEFYNGLNNINFVSDSVPVTVYLNGEFYLSAQKHRNIYYPFKETDEVASMYGYGIYYDSTCIPIFSEERYSDPYGQEYTERCGFPQIRFIKINEHIFNLKYEIPLVYQWGNWLSVRREFASVVSLDSADGIQLDLKVIKGEFNCRLRLSLCAVNSPRNFYQHGADKMWWYDDFPHWILCDECDWISVKAPFSKFAKAYGYGTRFDEKPFNTAMIVAYEISVVSDNQKEKVSGEFLVGNVRVYKEEKK